MGGSPFGGLNRPPLGMPGPFGPAAQALGNGYPSPFMNQYPGYGYPFYNYDDDDYYDNLQDVWAAEEVDGVGVGGEEEEEEGGVAASAAFLAPYVEEIPDDALRQ
ncbi:hypothetical protein B0A55_05786 [Friedmanniomyces simplex]|uniref:Uncharacterized protein n=1 Tax=Friedmanniomyces simplex TaxID=329884 RepID=A0A4U0XEW3_9PEZI|nr:hypothetical protein B0A55_05786 [Friedmanniomyces simplex]